MGDIHGRFIIRRPHVRILSTDQLSKGAVLNLGSINFDMGVGELKLIFR